MALVETDGVYRAPLLGQFAWLDHGFGGRFGPQWPPNQWPPKHHAAVVQVHGTLVITATEAGPQGEGDALITAVPGLYVTVRTADCLPLLMVDARQRRVAAVHAGWRGTVAGIPAAAIQAMGSDPADVWVAMGPGIGPCCFEVGDEVARQFGLAGRCYVDLFSYNRQKLIEIGVPDSQIAAEAVCTQCSPGEFHSFRRDKQDAGRMYAAIAVI